MVQQVLFSSTVLHARFRELKRSWCAAARTWAAGTLWKKSKEHGLKSLPDWCTIWWTYSIPVILKHSFFSIKQFQPIQYLWTSGYCHETPRPQPADPQLKNTGSTSLIVTASSFHLWSVVSQKIFSLHMPYTEDLRFTGRIALELKCLYKILVDLFKVWAAKKLRLARAR